MCDAVATAAPLSSGTRADGDAALAHFTDWTRYTGAHKHRFDEAGRGKGLAGRDSIAKGHGRVPSNLSYMPSEGLSSLADRTPADVRGVKLPPGSPQRHPASPHERAWVPAGFK